MSLFFFMYAGTFYYLFVKAFAKDAARAIVYFTWADRCAVVAIALFVISPALVLYAVNLADLGSVALGLWFVHIGVLFVTARSSSQRARWASWTKR